MGLGGRGRGGEDEKISENSDQEALWGTDASETLKLATCSLPLASQIYLWRGIWCCSTIRAVFQLGKSTPQGAVF